MASQRLSIRISPDLRRQLRLRAKAAGKRPSELVRAALEEYLQSGGAEENSYERAARCGLIGCVKDAPPDLSSNPQYFEGFEGRYRVHGNRRLTLLPSL